MTAEPPSTETMLVIRRTFAAPQAKVFHAWTDPRSLKKWCAPSDDFETLIAEVDLRVGGTYRIGMQPPGSAEMHIATGVYKEVDAPRRLVYTWSWEGGMEAGETVVTVEFRTVEKGTELMLKHEFFPSKDAKESHESGWIGCINRFERLLH
jgi:uncharacterized protein YndB with AHSA1/START domain